jgi:hypothetical protein
MNVMDKFILVPGTLFASFFALYALHADGLLLPGHAHAKQVVYAPLMLLTGGGMLHALRKFCAATRNEHADDHETFPFLAIAGFLFFPFVTTCLLGYDDVTYVRAFAPLLFVAAAAVLVGIVAAFAACYDSDEDTCKGLSVLFATALSVGNLLMGVTFAALKLDGKLAWRWRVAFVPFWIIDLCAVVPLLVLTAETAGSFRSGDRDVHMALATACSWFVVFPLVIAEFLACRREEHGGGGGATAFNEMYSNVWVVSPVVGAWALLLLLRLAGALDRQCRHFREFRNGVRRRLRERRGEKAALRGRDVSRNSAPEELLGDEAATAYHLAGSDYSDDEQGPGSSGSSSSARMRFDQLLRALASADGPAPLARTLSALRELVAENPTVLRTMERRAQIHNARASVGGSRLTGGGKRQAELWTTDVAQEYGKLLREMSAAKQLLAALSKLSGFMRAPDF